MPLTPVDVQQKTFRVALRGYAEDEVDEFLDEIVLSIREYEQRLEEMSFQVGTLESQLTETRQTEDAMRRTLLLAEKTAEEITDEARREAERIVSDARVEATALSADQTEERDALLLELRRLRDIVADVRERLDDVAGDTEARLEPVHDDIEQALAGFGDRGDDESPAASSDRGRGGLFAVDSDVDSDEDWEADDDGGDGFWDGGAGDEDRLEIDVADEASSGTGDGVIEATVDEASDRVIELEARADDAGDAGDDLGDRAQDLDADIGEADPENGDLDDDESELSDEADDDGDASEVRKSRRRPWERFGD